MTDKNPIENKPAIEDQSLVQPTMGLASYFAKKKRTKRIAIALILLALAALLWKFSDYYTARAEPLPSITAAAKGTPLAPPVFLFAITGGEGDLALVKPLDVAIHPNGNIYVTTGTKKFGKGRVEVFRPNGSFLSPLIRSTRNRPSEPLTISPLTARARYMCPTNGCAPYSSSMRTER